MVCEEADATGVGLMAVELRADTAVIGVRKNFGEQTVSTHVMMPLVCGLPRERSLWPTDDEVPLSQELDHITPHRVYGRALAMAVDLARGLDGNTAPLI